MPFELAIALTVVMLISVPTLLWQQWDNIRPHTAAEKRIEKLAALFDEWRMPK